MSERYVREAQVKTSLAKYRPAEQIKYTPEEKAIEEKTAEPQTNPFITDLQNEVNKDIIGWITIPNTQIDYPFVQSKDNNDYLRRDLYGNYALAGTIFMDSKCSEDFTDFNTIIYGHNMNNGSMFGELPLFEDEGFFEANKAGTIYLKGNTYALEIFAYMVVRADDAVIYSNITGNQNEFFEYVGKSARNYREHIEIEIEAEAAEVKKIVTLSTCSYQFDGARTVLLAAITDINPR